MNKSGLDRSTAVVEEALRTAPWAPVPDTLRSRVMRRVRSLPTAPRFAFPWLEGALSLMLSTLATGTAYLLIGIQPTTALRLQQSVRLFFLLPANRPLLIAAVPGVCMLAVCLLLTVLLFHPRVRAGRRAGAIR
jgi:hypothetical protein